MQDDLTKRRDHGLNIVQAASQSAKQYFADIDKLVIEAKGKQDLVSDADKGICFQGEQRARD